MYRLDSSSTATTCEEGLTSDSEVTCGSMAASDFEEVPIIHAQLAADHSEPVMIQAELAEDPPVIPQAQLVPPPQEAYHVAFDEEAPPSELPPVQPPMELDYDHPCKMGTMWRKHGRPCFRFGLLLLVVALIAAIAVPHVRREKHSEDLEDRLHWLEELRPTFRKKCLLWMISPPTSRLPIQKDSLKVSMLCVGMITFRAVRMCKC